MSSPPAVYYQDLGCPPLLEFVGLKYKVISKYIVTYAHIMVFTVYTVVSKLLYDQS